MTRSRICLATALLLPALCGGGCTSAPPDPVFIQADNFNQVLRPTMSDDGDLNVYFKLISDRLVDAARNLPRNNFQIKDAAIQAHWVNCSTVNATNTGGEHVYVYNGLFQLCENEDELAAVVSHEYAHVLLRHWQHNGIATTPLAPDIVRQFIAHRMTPDEEADADKLGFLLYARAGWEVSRFGDIFRVLSEKGLDPNPNAARKRAEDAQRSSGELPGNFADWRAVPICDKRRFREFQRSARSIRPSFAGQTENLLIAMPSCVTSQDQPDQVAAQKLLPVVQPVMRPG